MTQAKTQAEPEPYGAWVDELGPLDEQYEQAKSWIERREALRKRLREYCAENPAGTTIVLAGEKYVAAVGECANETVIKLSAVYKLLGKAKFLKHCGFTVKALKSLTTEAERAGMTWMERTGARPIKTRALDSR